MSNLVRLATIRDLAAKHPHARVSALIHMLDRERLTRDLKNGKLISDMKTELEKIVENECAWESW